MAIIPTITVAVIANGTIACEYHDQASVAQPNTVTRWIASTANTSFAVRIDAMAGIQLKGDRVVTSIYFNDEPHSRQLITAGQPANGNDQSRPIRLPPALRAGSIKIVAHHAVLANPEKGPLSRPRDVDLVGTEIFRYMPIEDLRVMGIVPRANSVQAQARAPMQPSLMLQRAIQQQGGQQEVLGGVAMQRRQGQQAQSGQARNDQAQPQQQLGLHQAKRGSVEQNVLEATRPPKRRATSSQGSHPAVSGPDC